jgi:hypothetical protein
MIWRVFKKKRDARPLRVVTLIYSTRKIMVNRMPHSQSELIEAICEYWKENEVPHSITEVLRYEKPQHVFWAVKWMDSDD